MKKFRFFEKERVFTDWMDALDDYHLGGIPFPNAYDRPINSDLYNRTTLGELSHRVQEIVRDPEFIPAGYIRIPVNMVNRYDSKVIHIVRRRMQHRLYWRGYNQILIGEPDNPLLTIISGINIGGMMHILYEITTHNTPPQRYRVSVPLVNLQRRG
jgi:hypothetical protein